jgi:parallel beta-helix repeat protein
VGQRVVLEDIQSKATQGTAIYLIDIRNVVIRRVNILDPGLHGIHLDRSAIGGFVNGEVENCSVRLPQGDGIHVDQGSALAIRHNRIEVAVNHGIHVAVGYACLIGENTISDADNVGIYLEAVDGSKVYNNVISRGEQQGMLIDVASHDNFILDNVVRQSGLGGVPTHPGIGGNGIWVQGDRNHLEQNTVNDSDGCGLLFNGNGNTFGRNMARGSDPFGIFCPAACGLFPPDSCDLGAGNASSQNNMIPNLF